MPDDDEDGNDVLPQAPGSVDNANAGAEGAPAVPRPARVPKDADKSKAGDDMLILQLNKEPFELMVGGKEKKIEYRGKGKYSDER